MRTKQLIVNADDFGLTEGINQAVIEGHRGRVISSASLMVTGEAAASAAALAAAHPDLGVGLHLNLTSGQPVLPPERVASLVNASGRLPGLAGAVVRLTTGTARRAELEAEIRAQIEACQSLGINPTHIDSHHHLHAHPRLRRILERLCPGLGIEKARGYRMRPRSLKSAAILAAAAIPAGRRTMRRPERFFGIEQMGGKDFTKDVAGELEALASGTLEFMCHPGYDDARLEAISTYSRPRRRELETLLGRGFRKMIDSSGARLVSFREL